MKYAVISDLHANLTALKAVMSDAAALGAESLVCLGDITGYGPLPAETLSLVKKSAALAVAGNHDDAVSGRIDPADFIDLAGDAVERHRSALSKDDLGFLSSLPYTAKIEGALLAHGDVTDPAAFNYIDDDDSAAANFEATDEQIVFVGHTHVPCIYITGASGRVYRLEAQSFVIEEGKRYIVNPGSVGYPRENDGKCFSSYALYDSAAKTVTFRFLPFLVSSVMQRGTDRGKKRILPIAMASALCAAAATVFLLPREDAPGAPNAPAVAAEKPSLAEKTLTLAPSAKKTRANLTLERGSPPAQVETIFLAPGGEKIKTESKHVKIAFSLALKIPEGAVSVKFKVFEATAGKPPRIKSFSPAAESD